MLPISSSFTARLVAERPLWAGAKAAAVPARRVRAAAVFMVTFAVVLVVRLSAAELARKRGKRGGAFGGVACGEYFNPKNQSIQDSTLAQ